MPTNMKDRYGQPNGRLGSSYDKNRPAHGGILIPALDLTDGEGRVVEALDLFSDSEAFVRSMIMTNAYTIVPGSAVYDGDDNLVSADIVWADGRAGTVIREMKDANGSYEDTVERISPTNAKSTYTLRKLIDGAGNEVGTLIGSGGGTPGDAPSLQITAALHDFACRDDDDRTKDGINNTMIQTYLVRAINRGTESVTIIAPEGWDVSLDGITYDNAVKFGHDNQQVVHLRLKSFAVGNYTATISHILGVAYVPLAAKGWIGDGTEAYPYPVYGAGGLDLVHDDLSANYKQVANIDLTGVEWMPIGSSTTPFTGTYDGNGKSITNLSCDKAGDTGLFGSVRDATIKKLSITGAVSGTNVGLLAGGVGTSEISDIDVNGTVDATDFAGGLIGYIGFAVVPTTKILRCSSAGRVISAYIAGGLLGGVNTPHTIEDCYSSADVAGDVAAGLIAGFWPLPWGGATLQNCYACGQVTGDTAGGLVAQYNNPGASDTLVSNYWDTDTSMQATSEIGIGKTTAEMKQKATFVGWDFVNTWEIDEGIDYPKLRR